MKVSRDDDVFIFIYFRNAISMDVGTVTYHVVLDKHVGYSPHLHCLKLEL